MKIKDDVLLKVTDDDINIDGTFIIPNEITIIGNFAFAECKSLKSIKIPDSVTKISMFAFSNCSLLTEINLPSGVNKIEFGSFHDCKSLKSINIPDSVTEIGNSVFAHCSSLTEINLPSSVTKIEISAFYDCKSLKSIKIPDSGIEIDDYAFSDCIALEAINIPDSFIRIKPYAFDNCINLNLNIKTSLFYAYKESISETFDVKTLTIYDRKVNLFNIKNSLRKIREEELYDKIKSELLDNKVKNKKCFKLSEHKEFIDKIIDNLENIYAYNYREDFDNYINDYINKNREISIENIEDTLNEIKNYKLDNLDNIKNLTKYPFIVSTIFHKIQSNYGKNIETIRLKKVLAKLTKIELRNPEDIIKVIKKNIIWRYRRHVSCK